MAVTYPYVRAATWADGSTTDTAAKRNTMEDGIFNAHQQPAARVFHNANQSITTATETTVAFNSERYDQAGGAASTQHDTVTNNGRLTCRFAGIYLIHGQIAWAGSPVSAVITVRLNGTTYIASGTSPVTVDARRMEVTTMYSLAINDFVELRVSQASGAGLNVLNFNNESPEFMWARVA